MRAFLLLAPIALMGLSAPAWAGKKEDKLAACMWERMPQSAEQFVVASTPQSAARGLFEGMSVCADGDMNVNTKALKKQLRATRPAEIRVNSVKPEIFVCMRDAEGKCEGSE